MNSENNNESYPGDESENTRTDSEVTDAARSLRELSVSGASAAPATTQSNLSPFAQVFVPRQRTQIIHVETLVTGQYELPPQPQYRPTTYTTSYSRPSVSNRLKISRPCVKTTEEYETLMRSNKFKPMEKLNLVIDLLQSNTISFEVIKGPFVRLAGDVRKDSNFLQLAVKVILNETMHKPSFCYNGARLCILFNKKVPTFHLMIADQCKVYLDTFKSKNSHLARDVETLRGVLNTLSEVLYHFAEKGVKYGDMAVCSRVLYETMTILIRLAEDKAVNIKNVCQSLKLSGRHLQKGDETSMTDLLLNLEAAVVDEVDENMKLRVRNIRGLYNTNWGYEEESSESETNPRVRSCSEDTWEDPTYDAESNEIDDTVYYGPDGKVLTPEEISFLLCSTTTTEASNDAGDEDTLWDPDNEQPELQKAFREFVNYSKNKK